MDEEQFKLWLQRATLFQKLANGTDVDFWVGYVQGLRRLYHGEAFGTAAEHNLWSTMPDDEPNLTRRVQGAGYRAGFNGIDPADLFLEMSDEPEDLDKLSDAVHPFAQLLARLEER